VDDQYPEDAHLVDLDAAAEVGGEWVGLRRQNICMVVVVLVVLVVLVLVVVVLVV